MRKLVVTIVQAFGATQVVEAVDADQAWKLMR